MSCWWVKRLRVYRHSEAGVWLVQQPLGTAAVDPKAIPRVPQDLTKREYLGTEIPENGRLSCSRSARDVVNFMRACDLFPFRSPWGYPRAKIGEREIAIVKACLSRRCGMVPGTVGQRVGPAMQVACADEWILVQRVICEGHYLDSAEVPKPGDQLDDGH
jgi:methionyl-tRNA formyltransferase